MIPGTTDPVGSVEELLALGEEIGYPLLIKAAAGGGGKGMEIVRSAEEAAGGPMATAASASRTCGARASASE
ncbi:MAG TPA: hypothetical protein VG939_09365 [Caulobacteraceae bacterium]|nr:hypothetical protein [Caulobacteraceae bacterium]